LAKKISHEKGWTGVIVGGAAEGNLASILMEDDSLNLLDWTGRGSVTSYWKVFQRARFSVCNDSGLAHVASLCGSPVQVIWGAGDPKRTEPLGPGRVRILFNPIDCWPCESNYCNQIEARKMECLKGIFPDAVWEEIQSGIRI
jgi:ADP-heptose:LPS heptosyltransferase